MHKSAILSVSLLALLLLPGCREEAQGQAVVEKPSEHKSDNKVEQEAGSSAQLKAAQSQAAAAGVRGAEPEAEPEVNPAAESALKSIPKAQKGVLMSQGTVRYIKLEGGFWGIITDNGQKILPRNLPKEYRKDGLRLSFEAEEIKGMMTIQQWGVFSSLSNITVIGQVDDQSQDPRI